MDKFTKSGDIYMKTFKKHIAIDIIEQFLHYSDDLEFNYELPDGNHIILNKYLKEEIYEKVFDEKYFANCLTTTNKSCDIDIQTDLIYNQFLTREYSFKGAFRDYYKDEKNLFGYMKKLKKF